MDVLVQRAQQTAPQTAEQATSNVGGTSGKPCRYGDKCMRPGCRFKHAGRAGGIIKNYIFVLHNNQGTK